MNDRRTGRCKGTFARCRRRDGRRGGCATSSVTAAFVALCLLLIPSVAVAQDGHIDLPVSMPGDRLLVQHVTEDGFELHTVNFDASERTVLTSAPTAADFAGTWSPDGRYIAFHRNEAAGNAVYVATSDGADVTRLADRGHTPSWSPDSTRLVYSASTEGDLRPLRIVDLDGSSTAIPGTRGGGDPVWSPNGAFIAYVDTQRSEVVVVRPDGSGRQVVAQGSSPQWSPDSAQVAFVRQRGSDQQLVIARRDGSQRRALATFTEILSPAFSPSGRDVAVAVIEEGGGSDIWRVEVASGSTQQLTDSEADDVVPTWTADSSTIAFTRADDLPHLDSPADAWRVSSSGGPPQPITDSGSDYAVEFAPGRSLRLAGVDRLRTAVELSRIFPSAETVVIARADDHPDALAGGPLAAALDAPVLLTHRDRLAGAVRSELVRLGAERAYLLGGHAALSPQVEQDLAEVGITAVTRLAGPDRFHTAAEIAGELAELVGNPERVLVVEGWHANPARGWPDALSAAALATHTGEPILPVIHDRIPGATRDAVSALDPERALIVGGTGAVSAGVESQLADDVGEVDRVAGSDRYDTSTRVADLAVDTGADPTHPWLATGRDWPDALASAPAAALDGGVLLLVDGRSPTGSVHSHVWLIGPPFVERAVIAGGTAAVSPAVRAAIEGGLSDPAED